MSRSAVTTANLEHYRPLSRVEVERRRSELLAAVSDSWLRSLVRDNKP